MKSLAIIRSESLTPDRIRQCAECLESNYLHLRFKFWRPENGLAPDFIVDRMFDVSGFATRFVVDPWYGVSGMDHSSKIDAIRAIFEGARLQWKELWQAKGCRSDGTADGGDLSRNDLLVGCGVSHVGYYCSFESLFRSTAEITREHRRRLCEGVISAIGMNDRIRAQIDVDGKLRVTADAPFVLNLFSNNSDKSDPSGFTIHGIGTPEQASQATKTILTEIAKSVGDGMIRANIPMQAYPQLFPELNQVARGWRLYVYGYSDGLIAKALEDQTCLESRKPGRYPAFNWWEDTNGPDVIGSAVVEDGECFLELASEGGGVPLLMERASVLENVGFHQVFP